MYLPKREQSKGKTDGNTSVAVDPKKESGGKRKGRSMKRKPNTFRHPRVTRENLETGRANKGYLNGDLNCVVYFVAPTKVRSIRGYGRA
jgi:hypothetical protein